jgi:uncharacterized protein YciI
MNYYALLYEAADDYVAKRPAFREQHLRLAQAARERGELVLAGAFADPVDRALIVFRANDKSKVEEFARQDPYVVNGLVKRWEVRPWTVVVGQERSSSSTGSAPGTILRRWSARTTAAQLPKYLDYFSRKVVSELRRVPGYLGANVSTRNLGNEIEILVETTWRSLESIRNFAGPDLEAAVVAGQAAALLTSFDGRVQHSEIAMTDRP